jgi:hypothetical protein
VRVISPRRIAAVRRGTFLCKKRRQPSSSNRLRSCTRGLQPCIRSLRSCTRDDRLRATTDMKATTGTAHTGTTTAGTRAENIISTRRTTIKVHVRAARSGPNAGLQQFRHRGHLASGSGRTQRLTALHQLHQRSAHGSRTPRPSLWRMITVPKTPAAVSTT